MRLFFDVTKTASSRQLSGLVRVSNKLKQAMGEKIGKELIPVVWHSRKKCFTDQATREAVNITGEDGFLTPEVFSSDERPGYYNALVDSSVDFAAIFHDAIPLKFPAITWPKSVARHPQYMEDLAMYSHVFSVSSASRNDLLAHWDSVGIRNRPTVSIVTLGADFFHRDEVDWNHRPQKKPLVLNVGIIEPRKNQEGLLTLAIELWDEGLDFELHFVGRINPHFGKPVEKKIKRVRKSGYPVFLHSKQSDGLLLDLYSRARLTVFNSIAEGFGLPVVESLWLGVPCVARSLPSLRDLSSVAGFGFSTTDEEMKQQLRSWLMDEVLYENALKKARNVKLGTWREASETILRFYE